MVLQEARAAIKTMIDKKLESNTNNETHQLTKDLAEDAKKCVRNLGKDPGYKYLIQVIVGQNEGQGVRMGSRQFWDKETDNLATVTVVKQNLFVTVCAFAVYLY